MVNGDSGDHVGDSDDDLVMMIKVPHQMNLQSLEDPCIINTSRMMIDDDYSDNDNNDNDNDNDNDKGEFRK